MSGVLHWNVLDMLASWVDWLAEESERKDATRARSAWEHLLSVDRVRPGRRQAGTGISRPSIATIQASLGSLLSGSVLSRLEEPTEAIAASHAWPHPGKRLASTTAARLCTG